jgi:CubicO group peptidase (beta-lactamase class C family)
MLPIRRREFGGIALVLGAAAGRASGSKTGDGKIDETLSSGIAQRKIPAVVGMVASKDEILYAGAFGTRDSSGTPVTTDSIFAIASMTKAVTTVAALQLVEQGKVRLKEPVSKYLPQLQELNVLEGFDAGDGQSETSPGENPGDTDAPAHSHIGILLRQLGRGHVSLHIAEG